MIAGVVKEDMAVATGSEFCLYPHDFSKHSVVTYLFRTTGQVLGVSLSGAILQAVLLQQLRIRIQDPNSAQVGFSANHIPT
jgi:hypothetical protein